MKLLTVDCLVLWGSWMVGTLFIVHSGKYLLLLLLPVAVNTSDSKHQIALHSNQRVFARQLTSSNMLMKLAVCQVYVVKSLQVKTGANRVMVGLPGIYLSY